MTDETKKIYACSNPKDDTGQSKLIALLEDNGMQVENYLDGSDNADSVHSEDDIRRVAICPKIEQCSTVVVCISPEVKDSDRVNWEIEIAHSKGKRIVGVWEYGGIGCEMPEALTKFSDAVVDWKEDRILDAINGEINETRNPDGTLCTPTQFERYCCAKSVT